MTAPTVPIEKLRPAEKRLVEEGGSGVVVGFERSAPKEDRTIRASVLRDFLLGRYGSSTSADFDPKGVHLEQAVIEGELDISGLELAFPLEFEHCEFEDVQAKQFRGRRLILRECALSGILDLDGCHITGHVDLSKSTFQKQVSVRNARIEGVFVATEASFEFDTSTTDVAIEIEEGKHLMEKSEVRARLATFASLNLDESEVSGSIVLNSAKFKGSLLMRGAHTVRSVILAGADLQCAQPIAWLATSLRVDGDLSTNEGFTAKGEVRLIGAEISGYWNCNDGRFLHEGEKCLNADGIEVGGDLFMRDGFKANGEVRLLGAKVAGNWECDGGKCRRKGEKCLNADSIEVGGSLFMRDGFAANGEVLLLGAKVAGNWECDRAKFLRKGANCLTADRIEVGGSLFMRDGFKANGEVRLPGAKVGGQWVCDGGKFLRKGKNCLNADGIEVGGDLFMQKGQKGFEARGEVRLPGAKVGGQWSCNGGKFRREGKICLNADDIEVRADLFMQSGFEAKGEVRLLGAKLGKGVYVDHLDSVCKIDLSHAEIGDRLNLSVHEESNIDLSNVSVAVLDLTPMRSDTTDASFKLVGLAYDNIDIGESIASGSKEAKDVIERLIRLLARSDAETHYPQPYRQMVRALREHGYQHEAIQVAIAKRGADHVSKSRDPKNWATRFRSWLIKKLTGCGYYPQKVLRVWLYVMAAGIAVYYIWGAQDTMAPSEGDVLVWQVEHGQGNLPIGYPPYISWLYALDEFIPIIDLGQADRYRPSPDRLAGKVPIFGSCGPKAGDFLLVVDVVLDLLGWVLASLLIAAYSGLIRQVGRDE